MLLKKLLKRYIKNMLKDKLAPDIVIPSNVKCFLDYALPAVGCRNNFHKTDELENALLTGYVPNMGSLSCFFPDGFNWMLTYLKKNREEIDDITPDKIRSYFWIGHSEVIDRGEGIYSAYPQEARDHCKIMFGKVRNSSENQVYLYCQDRKVHPPALKKTELIIPNKTLVTVHAGQIAEVINEDLYKKIMGREYK
jgi:hypothetical protein